MFDTMKNAASGLMGNKKIIILLGVTVLFIIIAIYLYNNYISPRMNPAYVSNKEFVRGSDEEGEDAEIFLFYTEWCPHCKKAKPIWAKLKEEYDGKRVNNHTLYFREVDCEKEEELADKFKIEGYPTIKLLVGDKEIEYDAKPTEENIREFIHSSLD